MVVGGGEGENAFNNGRTISLRLRDLKQIVRDAVRSRCTRFFFFFRSKSGNERRFTSPRHGYIISPRAS